MKVSGELKNAQVEATTTANRPTPAQKGRILYDVNTSQLIYDTGDGGAWEVVQTGTGSRVIYEEAELTSEVLIEGDTPIEITALALSVFPNTGLYRVSIEISVDLDLLSGSTYSEHGYVDFLFYITDAAGNNGVLLNAGGTGNEWTLGVGSEGDIINYSVVHLSLSLIIDLSDSAYSAALSGGCKFKTMANVNSTVDNGELQEGSLIRIEKLPNHLSYADNSNSWT